MLMLIEHSDKVLTLFSGIMSFTVAFTVFFIILGLSLRFEDNIPMAVIKMLVLASVTGLCCYYETAVKPMYAMLMLVAMIIAMIYMIIWWMYDASDIKELIFFILLDIIFAFVAQGAAARVLDLTDNGIVIGIVRVLPAAVFVVSVGCFIADMIWFRKDLRSADFDPSDYVEVGGELR